MLSSARSKRAVVAGLATAISLMLPGVIPTAAAQSQSGNAGGQVLNQQARQNAVVVLPPAPNRAMTMARSGGGAQPVNVNTSVSVAVAIIFNIVQQCQQSTNSCIVYVR